MASANERYRDRLALCVTMRRCAVIGALSAVRGACQGRASAPIAATPIAVTVPGNTVACRSSLFANGGTTLGRDDDAVVGFVHMGAASDSSGSVDSHRRNIRMAATP